MIGFRMSGFLRPSAFGFRILCPVLIFLIGVHSLLADSNSIPEVPASLRPPRGELMPGFWELYAGWVILGAVLVVVGIATFVWLLMLPKPTPPIPPAIQARQELEPLRQRTQDGTVLSQVSQIVRHYVARAFAMPPGELTTTEFSGTLRQNQNIGSELGGEVIAFLRECDLRKFAPRAPQTPFDAVSRASSLIDRAENRVAELRQLHAENNVDSTNHRQLEQKQGVSREA